jgi:hypothetical protein
MNKCLSENQLGKRKLLFLCCQSVCQLFLLSPKMTNENLWNYKFFAVPVIEVSAELADASDIAAELVELVDVFIESDDSDDLREDDAALSSKLNTCCLRAAICCWRAATS